MSSIETWRRIRAGLPRVLPTILAVVLAGAVFSAHAKDPPSFETVSNAVEETVIGQQQAKETLFGIAKRQLTGSRSSGSAAVMLAYGPSGLGKKTLFETYARAIGAAVYVVPVDRISQHDPDSLLKEIARRLKTDPRTVVVFQNFELVSDEVLGALLSVFDANAVTTAGGRVSADKALFGITTTAASDFVDAWTTYREEPPLRPIGFMTQAKRKAIREIPTDFVAELPKNVPMRRSRDELIKDGIRQALLERCEGIAPVFPPSPHEFLRIFAKHFNEALEKFARQKRVTVDFSDESSRKIQEAVLSNVYHDDISHGEILVTVRQILDDALADVVMKDGVKKGDRIRLTFDAEKVRLRATCVRKLKSRKLEGADAG